MADYQYKAHPTYYKGTLFRSRLEATWAAFFDLAGWTWRYEPIDLNGWTPDFWVSFPCRHSECDGSHELYVEVKPYDELSMFEGHAVTKIEPYTVPSAARFGIDPSVTRWEMAHGAGGGMEDVTGWVHDWEQLWAEAKNLTQWRPRFN